MMTWIYSVIICLLCPCVILTHGTISVFLLGLQLGLLLGHMLFFIDKTRGGIL